LSLLGISAVSLTSPRPVTIPFPASFQWFALVPVLDLLECSKETGAPSHIIGTIAERRKKDGSMTYTAQLRIMRDGSAVCVASSFERRPKPGCDGTSRKPKAGRIREGQRRVEVKGKTLDDAISKCVSESEFYPWRRNCWALAAGRQARPWRVIAHSHGLRLRPVFHRGSSRKSPASARPIGRRAAGWCAT
jgi:hypothetical protein